MKQSLPRPLRAFGHDRLVLILFSPVLACVLFSMLLMGLHVGAWAAEGDAVATPRIDEREDAPNGDSLSVVEDAGSTWFEDEPSLTANNEPIVVEEEILDDLMGATASEHEQMASEASEAFDLDLQSRASELSAQRNAFVLAVQEFESEFGAEGLENADANATPVSAEDIECRKAAAFQLLQSARRELLRAEGPDALETFAHVSSLRDATVRQEMLDRLVVSQTIRLERLVRDKKLMLATSVLEAVDVVRDKAKQKQRVEEIGDHALRIDALCSEMRQALKDSRATLPRAQGFQLFSLVVDALQSGASDAVQLMFECERLVADWYDRVDALADAKGALAFGMGLDFALPEEAFVQKWGAAIDAFYATQGVARETPLHGFGNVMAQAAYLHKIDPRLCAAVSMAESSGGRFCVRPFNAWGWGAADSDPYGLAVEWSSFDEGIRSWHEGVASSTTGLATASCISELASIYCSSPRWGATVAQLMQQVGSLA